LNKYIKCNV